MIAFFLGVAATQKFDGWSLAAGAVLSAAIALVIFARDDPPQYVQNWRRGAEGERRTERALRPLQRQGWSIWHDIQRQGANLDHVVTGPSGTYLLETKNLAGTITFENGALVARQFDDPDEVYRYTTLPSRLRGQAKELSAQTLRETGSAVWVSAVVVIWGHFSGGPVEHENVTYLAGDQLASWLSSR